jgi:hypothetical protein
VNTVEAVWQSAEQVKNVTVFSIGKATDAPNLATNGK